MHHEIDHRQLDHRDAALGLCLVVFAQPSVPAEPGEPPLDGPAFGQDFESFDVIATLHDLHLAAQTLDGLRECFAAEPAIGPELLEAAVQTLDLDEHLLAAFAFGGVGPDDHSAQDQPEHIDDQETLAAKGLLARVVAVAVVLEGASVLTLWLSMTPTLGGLLADLAADLLAQLVVDEFPRPVNAKGSEVVVGTGVVAEVFGQHPPGTASATEVEDGVNYLPHVEAAGAAAGDGLGD